MATDLQIAARKILSVNPATGEVLRELDCAGETEVAAAVERAHTAQAAWADLGLQHRIAVLREFQKKLYSRKSAIADAITREVGKPLAEALVTEVLVVLDAARFLIDNAFSLLRDEPVPHGNLVTKLKRGWLVREPRGVIGIISPWNYPFSIPATETLAALVAGNAVVLKPSELTPLVALELASLLHVAGVPEDVFQVVVGEGPAGAALVHSPINKLVFTGSVTTGKRIAAAAADRLLPVVLELGGKDPMLVLDDADVDVASSAAVWGSFRQRRAGLPVGRALLRAS
jgi:succinate-semialdehyde dehydrogenase/glutarate-semialdehyde dehydrogenase